MSARIRSRRLPGRDLQAILEVTSLLATPFDLMTMLEAVVKAAKQVLHADRGSVWLLDSATNELVLEVATGIHPVRVPVGAGLVGVCARTREIINVPDCYADPRFDAAVDRASGYRTRSMLTLPLVDHQGVLVGVMQLLNKAGGVFDPSDELLATALAAQCAIALQRVRMMAALIEGEKMRRELEMAREVQMSTLPATMPALAGYDVSGRFEPADQTGGDTFDVALVDGRLLIVLADATGHGIGPALSVTQMHAMLRLALGLGTELDTVYTAVNNRLADTLPADRFITAFIGVLDPSTHRLRFHSGGQGPILKFSAAKGACERYAPTSFPLGAMPLSSPPPSKTLDMEPGDILVLLSDGIFECRNPDGDAFGERRVGEVVLAHSGQTSDQLLRALLGAARTFSSGAPQEDDMTLLLVKRAVDAGTEHRHFARSLSSLPQIVAFTATVFSRHQIDPALRPTVDLGVEELFTNMVKYSTMSDAEVRVAVAPIDGGLEVTLTDYGVAPFDVTKADRVDIGRPVEQREPGGLGLHLVRRLVDSLEYEYDSESRCSRIVFRVTDAGRVARAGQQT